METQCTATAEWQPQAAHLASATPLPGELRTWNMETQCTVAAEWQNGLHTSPPLRRSLASFVHGNIETHCAVAAEWQPGRTPRLRYAAAWRASYMEHGNSVHGTAEWQPGLHTSPPLRRLLASFVTWNMERSGTAAAEWQPGLHTSPPRSATGSNAKRGGVASLNRPDLGFPK